MAGTKALPAGEDRRQPGELQRVRLRHAHRSRTGAPRRGRAPRHRDHDDVPRHSGEAAYNDSTQFRDTSGFFVIGQSLPLGRSTSAVRTASRRCRCSTMIAIRSGQPREPRDGHSRSAVQLDREPNRNFGGRRSPHFRLAPPRRRRHVHDVEMESRGAAKINFYNAGTTIDVVTIVPTREVEHAEARNSGLALVTVLLGGCGGAQQGQCKTEPPPAAAAAPSPQPQPAAAISTAVREGR